MGNAQNLDPAVAGAISAMYLGMLVFGIIYYIYLAISLQTIAKKTNTENGWLAWVPIANIYLMIKIAARPVWWLALFLIPIVNIASIVLAIILWMDIAKARGKESWWGIMMIIPLVNMIVPGYLAFSE